MPKKTQIRVRNGRTYITPGRPPTPAKQRTYYKGRLSGVEGRKQVVQMSPEERDRAGRRAPRMLSRGVRDRRALERQTRQEDLQRSAFGVGIVKTS